MDEILKTNLSKVDHRWGYLSLDNLLTNLFDLKFQLLHIGNFERKVIEIEDREIKEKFKKINFNYTVKR